MEVLVEADQELTQPHHDVKLFNRWTFDDVQVTILFFNAPLVLTDLYGSHDYFYSTFDAILRFNYLAFL